MDVLTTPQGRPLEVTARILDAGGPRIVTFVWTVTGTPVVANQIAYEDLSELQLDDFLNASLVLDEQPALPRMSTQQLDIEAPKQRYVSTKLGDCTCGICLDKYTARTTRHVRTLQCGHVFCNKCIVKWVTQHSATCPTCRKDLLPQI